MTRRTVKEPKAKHIFTIPRTVATGHKSHRPNSRDARSHAAFWGGASSRTTQTVAKAGDKINSKTRARSLQPVVPTCSPPKLFPSSSVRALDVLTASVNASIQNTCGNLFGQEFLNSLTGPLAKGYLLVAVAYSMAVAGEGDMMGFLVLKEQLLRSVRQELEENQFKADLQSLGLMLLLGSPAVCLLSRRLPGGLGVAEYLAASATDSTLCCGASAAIARECLSENEVHWHHLYNVIRRQYDGNAYQLQWLDYLARYMEITRLSDSAYFEDKLCRPYQPKSRGADYIGRGTPHRDWLSPLATEWNDLKARTCLETPMHALGRMMQAWLATFLDSDHTSKEDAWLLLEERLRLGRKIEHFVGVAVTVTGAETAMLSCCQWAAMVMLKSDRHRISLWQAARQTPTRPRLVTTLRMTDLGTLWGPYKGMLYWVVSVCHRSTSGKCFPLLTTALLSRLAHVLALSEQYEAIGLTPLTRLAEFEHMCCDGTETPTMHPDPAWFDSTGQ
ncbi:uncharacterized protein AB675_2290 [Cyphellophora attinorum]|uniref:Uncharacterized protein n=1 Tax=Cyphellophora attinorum TaxID=1664694 RepID=A0A0N1HG46_9EURO|nr:uncharacterized protein AB675_2290 [Phialophora attinorum]KPI45034.1 hypothetical protein AB675_2290 [Phialophora attinorum]